MRVAVCYALQHLVQEVLQQWSKNSQHECEQHIKRWKNPAWQAVVETLQKASPNLHYCLILVQLRVGVHVLLEIHIEKLKDQVQLPVLMHDIFKAAGRAEVERKACNLFGCRPALLSAKTNAYWQAAGRPPHNVLVVELFEQRDLSNCRGRDTLLLLLKPATLRVG